MIMSTCAIAYDAAKEHIDSKERKARIMGQRPCLDVNGGELHTHIFCSALPKLW